MADLDFKLSFARSFSFGLQSSILQLGVPAHSIFTPKVESYGVPAHNIVVPVAQAFGAPMHNIVLPVSEAYGAPAHISGVPGPVLRLFSSFSEKYLIHAALSGQISADVVDFSSGLQLESDFILFGYGRFVDSSFSKYSGEFISATGILNIEDDDDIGTVYAFIPEGSLTVTFPSGHSVILDGLLQNSVAISGTQSVELCKLSSTLWAQI